MAATLTSVALRMLIRCLLVVLVTAVHAQGVQVPHRSLSRKAVLTRSIAAAVCVATSSTAAPGNAYAQNPLQQAQELWRINQQRRSARKESSRHI